MFPFTIRPDQAVQELVEFNQKLAAGIKTLQEVGPVEVGVSPKEEVYREDKVVLYRFTPAVAQPHRVPVLVVYALVNRPYMADLQDGRSMIQGLLKEGMEVYLIDWGYPDGADRYLTLDDYINGYIHRAVEVICERHDLYRINLLGICQGGTFSTCYSAMHPDKVRNLVTMVTPIDFHTEGNLLAHWASKLDVDLLTDTLGNIPGELLNFTFLSMKPFQLTTQKYLDLVPIMDNPEKLKNFLRMESWIFDSPDQAGEAFRQFIKDFFQNNRLIRGEVMMGQRRVDLSKINMPVLNVFATEDHLVPPEASQALKRYISSKDYEEMAFQGGHIGIYVSGRAQRDIPPGIAKWLQARG